MENSYLPPSERRIVIGRRLEARSSLPPVGEGSVSAGDIWNRGLMRGRVDESTRGFSDNCWALYFSLFDRESVHSTVGS